MRMPPHVLKPLPRRLVAVGYFLLAAAVVAILMVQNVTLQTALAHARADLLVNQNLGRSNNALLHQVLRTARNAHTDHHVVISELNTLSSTVQTRCK